MATLKPRDILLVFQLIGFAASNGPPRVTGAASQQITARVGTVIKLPCPVAADPSPIMEWYKDTYHIHKGWDRFKVTSKFLKIQQILPADAGHYMCKAVNGFGSVAINITLRVTDGSEGVKKHNLFPQRTDKDSQKAEERFKSKPEILPPHPMNITVNYASTASFQCRVKSSVQPHIQWLKLAEEGSFPVNQNATLVFNGHHFVVLETGSVLHTTDGTYLNKLVIPRATEADSGMYICMGANSMGFSFREAFLFVTTDRTRQFVSRSSSQPTGSFSLALVIALPLVMVIVLMAGFGYVIQQRRQCCTNRSPTVQRLPVPTHDKDVYPAVHNPHMYPASHNSSQNKYAKPYSSVDYYTDISSASRSHPSHHQHQHTHYNY